MACAPGSSLTSCFEDAGYTGMRINYKNGYDLDKKDGTTKLAAEVKEKQPRLTWVSLPCTQLSPLQNLTPRTELQRIAPKTMGRLENVSPFAYGHFWYLC